MDRWAGRVALVTGASVGIGAAVVEKLTQHGMLVVGCARNLDKLNQVAQEILAKNFKGKFWPLKCDLQEEADIKKVFDFIRNQFQRLDVCINNAGLANNAPLICGSTEQWKEMLNVNVLGLSICTREAVQLMFEKGVDDGQIIQLSSMSGHRVVHRADVHFYSATKYAVRALTEGLRQELREKKSGIRVCGVSPGVVETEFALRLHHDNPEKGTESYTNMKCIQPEDIAQVVCNILEMPSNVEINDVLLRPTQQVF